MVTSQDEKEAEKKEEKRDEREDTRANTVNKMQGVLRLLVVLTILSLGGRLIEFIQDGKQNEHIERVEQAASEAKTAANDAKTAARNTEIRLNRAIEDSQQQDPSGPVPVALREIHQILIILQNLDAYLRNTG